MQFLHQAMIIDSRMFESERKNEIQLLGIVIKDSIYNENVSKFLDLITNEVPVQKLV